MRSRLVSVLAILTRTFYTSSSSGPSGLLRVNHALLQNIVKIGDTCVDATCGNGFDSLFLSRILFPSGTAASARTSKLYCIDIQPESIHNTTQRLQTELDSKAMANVHLSCSSHASLPTELKSDPAVAAVIYNLGYLPGSKNKTLVTHSETTLQSLLEATLIVKPGGIITCMAYKHDDGDEERQVRSLLGSLDLRYWDVNCHFGIQGGASTTGPVLYSARRRA